MAVALSGLWQTAETNEYNHTKYGIYYKNNTVSSRNPQKGMVPILVCPPCLYSVTTFIAVHSAAGARLSVYSENTIGNTN